MAPSLGQLFNVKKPVIGMIHLAGSDDLERLKIALEELKIYEAEGLDGAIIGDYHGSSNDACRVLEKASSLDLKLVLGINILNDPYSSFGFARTFKAGFVQFDSVQTPDLDLNKYHLLRKIFKYTAVLGGVGFKYTRMTGNPLEVDIEEAKSRCEAIVTTGTGTGEETPLEKLKEYKKILGNFPLVVGAGVTLDNVLDQLGIADGAIIGSYFKPGGDTREHVERKRVRDLMDVVREVRGLLVH